MWVEALRGDRVFACYLAGLPPDDSSSIEAALDTMRFAARRGTARPSSGVARLGRLPR